MPPLRLTNLLQTALPDVSKPGRAILSALACMNGHAHAAKELAAWVGLRDRYQLSRVLRRDGLPPFEQLAGWARVIYWLTEAERSGVSLLELAHREHVHAAAAYRLVRRVTGSRWSEIRRLGLTGLLAQLRDTRRPRLGTALITRASPSGLAIVPPGRADAEQSRKLEGTLGNRVLVDDGPFDVAMTATGLGLITCGHAACVNVVALDPFRRLGAIRTGAVPTRVRVSPAGDRAYVTSQFAEEVGVLDLRLGRQVSEIATPGHPLGAALAPDGRTLYVTTNADRLLAVSPGARRILASGPVPLGTQCVSVHPAGHRVYVSGWNHGSVTECDASSLRVVRTFQLGGVTQDSLITRAGTMFVANQAGWVDVLALGNGRCIGRIDTGGAAHGLALSPDESVLLVTLLFDGVVCVVDPRTLRVRTRLYPGGMPRFVAFAPSGNTALVANEAGWVDQVM
jgi:DNA-binding beta-propeller fold protein YncE